MADLVGGGAGGAQDLHLSRHRCSTTEASGAEDPVSLPRCSTNDGISEKKQ